METKSLKIEGMVCILRKIVENAIRKFNGIT